jgi:hypothetical protein
VHEKTGGNPFFAIQFISALAEEGLLRFDHDAAGWHWELDRVYAKGYTDNVVDLMVGKLSRLPLETQAALQQLACLGNAAEITMLSIVLSKSNEDVGSESLGRRSSGTGQRQISSGHFDVQTTPTPDDRDGRKPKLSDHQRKEAIKRRDAGDTLAEIAKSYAVDLSTTKR